MLADFAKNTECRLPEWWFMELRDVHGITAVQNRRCNKEREGCETKSTSLFHQQSGTCSRHWRSNFTTLTLCPEVLWPAQLFLSLDPTAITMVFLGVGREYRNREEIKESQCTMNGWLDTGQYSTGVKVNVKFHHLQHLLYNCAKKEQFVRSE